MICQCNTCDRIVLVARVEEQPESLIALDPRPMRDGDVEIYNYGGERWARARLGGNATSHGPLCAAWLREA